MAVRLFYRFSFLLILLVTVSGCEPKLLRTIGASVAAALTGSSGGGGGSSHTFGITASGLRGMQAAVGDFDHDGDLDVAFVSQTADEVLLVANNGSGVFGAASAFAVSQTPIAVTTGDSNQDGNLDLLVTTDTATMELLRGDGTGGFAAAASEAGGAINTGIAASDLTRDGVLDVVVSILDTNQVIIFESAIGLGATSFSVGNAPTGVAIGDLDHDGNPDVVVANSNDNTISVRLGTGTPGAALGAETTFSMGTTPVGIALGDFDKDGNLDVVTTNSGSANVSVRAGDGAGSFNAEATYNVGTTPVGVVIGDFNKDGDLDLAVTNYGSDTLSVLSGGVGATFGAAVNTATSDSPLASVAGDFDRDGALDAIAVEIDTAPTLVAGSAPLKAGTFTRTTTIAADNAMDAAIGDIDNDGDLDIVVAAFGTGNVITYDNDGTGGFGVTETLNIGTGPGSQPAAVELADMNQDGWLDFVVATRADSAIAVYQNDGDGTFSFRDDISMLVGGGGNPWDVEVGDLDKNGTIDVVLIGAEFDNDTGFEAFSNDGTGVLTSVDSITHAGDNSRRGKLIDLDNDGDLDILIGVRDTGDLVMALNDGSGGFPAAFTTVLDEGVGNDIIQPRAADINRDGWVDVVLGNASGMLAADDRELQILLGDGLGGFGAATNQDLMAGSGIGHEVLFGDWNNDGYLDVAVSLQSNASVDFMSGNGATFTLIEQEGNCTDPRHGAVGDLNGDGHTDVVMACQADNVANVYILD